MIAERWETREPAGPAFLERWTALAARAPQFNFTMDARFLAWEAAHGRHAVAAIAEEGGRRAALVLRRERSELVSGWPWRWQAAVESPPAAERVAPAPATCAWLFAAAGEVAGRARLVMHLPARPRGVPAYRAGGTLLLDLAPGPDALLARMDVNKRRAVKKAAKEGFAVSAATSADQRRAFFALQQQANAWREPAASAPSGEPAPGEGHREWEQPWALLLVAERDGALGAGSGFGWTPGGTLDYRTNASTNEARRAGANAQLAFEGLRHAAGLGCALANWGGVTEFKRELGGERVTIHRWLGGGARWAPVNLAEAAARNARGAIAGRLKSLRAGAPARKI